MDGRGWDDALAFPSINEISLAEWKALRSLCRATWRWTARAVGTAAVWLLGSATSRAGDLPVVTWQGQTMGSVYTVKIVGTNVTSAPVEGLKSAIEHRLQEVNRQMSHYQPDSELSRFNRAPAKVPFKVSPEFARIVRLALEINRRSRGAFDPTLAPVINLWGFGEQSDRRAVPAEAEVKKALAKTGCAHLSVTPQDELVKDIPELALNLSGIAKGFGVDEMVRILIEHGFTNCYASIAGEVRVHGWSPRSTPWLIGVSAPISNWRDHDPMAAAVSLSDQAISTSGDYQKFFFDAQGRRLSHIFDPRTGWPVQHDVGGVSVVASDATTADALATTLFVLGRPEGMRFIESWTNAAALFIVREPEGRFRDIPSSRFPALLRESP
jgi:thiamine biosynthesis lipoprotein